MTFAPPSLASSAAASPEMPPPMMMRSASAGGPAAAALAALPAARLAASISTHQVGSFISADPLSAQGLFQVADQIRRVFHAH